MSKYEDLLIRELALMGKALEARDKALACAQKLICGEDRDGRPLSVEKSELLVKKFENFRKRGIRYADEALAVGFESIAVKHGARSARRHASDGKTK